MPIYLDELFNDASFALTRGLDNDVRVLSPRIKKNLGLLSPGRQSQLVQVNKSEK